MERHCLRDMMVGICCNGTVMEAVVGECIVHSFHDARAVVDAARHEQRGFHRLRGREGRVEAQLLRPPATGSVLQHHPHPYATSAATGRAA